jgi:hypothetical protein
MSDTIYLATPSSGDSPDIIGPGDVAEYERQGYRVDGPYVRTADPDPATQEWLTLLELATEYMVAAEALIDILRGGVPIPTTGRADIEVKRAIARYTTARHALAAYARKRETMLL